MLFDIVIQKEWDIPDSLAHKFNTKTLKKILRAFNQMSGGSYFFVDYYHKELIVDTSESRVLCGHPKELAIKEGLSFFKYILKEEEILWQQQMLPSAMDVFFSLAEEERQHLMLLYDMNVQLSNGEEQILHYKTTPFQLCENGNLWLALGCVSSAISHEPGHNVCIVNVSAFTRYDFVNGTFVASKINLVTPEEKEILLLLVKNMLESDICRLLKMNKYKYHRVKNVLFEKLEVDTPAGAVQRAHHLGLI